MIIVDRKREGESERDSSGNLENKEFFKNPYGRSFFFGINGIKHIPSIWEAVIQFL